MSRRNISAAGIWVRKNTDFSFRNYIVNKFFRMKSN
jgi:hypothetical protein